MIDTDEETDIELVTRLATTMCREMVFQSAALHLDIEQILAGTVLAWQSIKGGELPGIDALRAAMEIATGTPATETAPGPVEHHTGPYL